ncbi:hypothetical protein C8J56DRAFT_1038894 [Mycena floridula]|nr:hypothetical protein C8J56DRAFT_1038894 [Mycena floridula]
MECVLVLRIAALRLKTQKTTPDQVRGLQGTPDVPELEQARTNSSSLVDGDHSEYDHGSYWCQTLPRDVLGDRKMVKPLTSLDLAKLGHQVSLKLKEIKVKKGDIVELSEAVVRSRLHDIPQYPVPEDWDISTTRAFFKTFGGNEQCTMARIVAKHIAIHGIKRFMFPSLRFNPNAPRTAGAPGLFLDIGKAWTYMGNYSIQPSRSLSIDEWKALGPNVRPDVLVEPQFENIGTEEDELKEAFDCGTEKIAVWTMRCVGYDANFQRRIANKSRGWVDPPRKRKITSGKAKGVNEDDDDDDEEDYAEVDEDPDEEGDVVPWKTNQYIAHLALGRGLKS